MNYTKSGGYSATSNKSIKYNLKSGEVADLSKIAFVKEKMQQINKELAAVVCVPNKIDKNFEDIWNNAIIVDGKWQPIRGLVEYEVKEKRGIIETVDDDGATVYTNVELPDSKLLIVVN